MTSARNRVPGRRSERGRGVPGAKRALRRLLAVLALAAGLAGGVAHAGEVPAEQGGSRVPANCPPKVWRNATDHVWFYDAGGGPVIPQVNYAWLIVHLQQVPPAEDDPEEILPPAMVRLNQLFAGQIVDFVYDPMLDPDLCMYRVKHPEQIGKLAADMARAEGGSLVRYLRPAYTIGDANFALLDAIDIRWKTQAGVKDRQALLAKAGVASREEDAGEEEGSAGDEDTSRLQRVRVDPCRASVWETANLLHEDLHVVSASPVLARVEPPVRADFRVGLNGATVGAPLPFTLEIAFAERIRIEPATIANLNLCPQDLARNLCRVEYQRPLSAVDVSVSPIRVEGALYLYGTGEFVLPEVPVYYRQAGAEETGLAMIRTAGVPLRIASVIPAAAGSYQLQVADPGALPDIRGAAPPAGRRQLALGLAAGGAVLFLACLGGLWHRSLPERGALPEPSGPETARQQAEILRGLLQVDRDRFGSAELVACGRATRAYLAATCRLPAGSLGGGAEVFCATIRHALPPELRAGVAELLELIDDGLSRGELRRDDVDRIFAHLRTILSRCEGGAP